MSNRNDFGDSFTIELKPDMDGYIGRECPASNCLGYFKVTFGTGIKGPVPCHCPYCGHSGDHQTFFTQAQLDYIDSVALRKVDEVISRELKSLEFEHKPEGPFGIGISLKFKESPAPPIRHYREKKLETEIICENCTLRYAIYGVFAWCPDCGIHNSLQMLLKNLELATKELELSESIGADLSDHLIKEALSTIVAAVDGFGREICSQNGAADIRFQNLTAARKKVQERFGFDFADPLRSEDWEQLCRLFQKRHLLAHKMGVMDAEYVQKSKDPDSAIGRKLLVGRDEVSSMINIIEVLGRRLFAGMFRP